MAAHAVARYADSAAVELGEGFKECIGKLGGYVAVHFVAFGPRLFCGVDIEACATAEVVGVVFALDFKTA